MKTSLLPGERFPNRSRRRYLARKCWYVRLAERIGVVPHPEAKEGVVEFMMATCPEAFPTPELARPWARRRPWEIVAEHWGRHIIETCVVLPGEACFIHVLVHASSLKAANLRLRRALPDGSIIEVRRVAGKPEPANVFESLSK